MYPGYIFVETSAIGELTFFVKGCDGATGLLQSKSGEVKNLPNSEVDRMLGVQQEITEKQEIENRFVIGEEVKILDGPFTTFTGTIESITDQKVKISVLIFGRKTPVELNLLQIDRIY